MVHLRNHYREEGGRAMPLKASDYPIPIGLRISPEQARKIDTMASQLGLQRNALLRLLVNCARLDRGAVIFGVGIPRDMDMPDREEIPDAESA